MFFPVFSDSICFFASSSDGISQEIELLEAIYVSELEVHGPRERLVEFFFINVVLTSFKHLQARKVSFRPVATLAWRLSYAMQILSHP